jgi:NAD(P)H-dependent flavin oxidoreductase YrpB (nitropropane dioxygenase family)
MVSYMPDNKQTSVRAHPRILNGEPVLISGGMGIWVSNWRMSRILSLLGGMGIVSGTALEVVYVRLLQQGDKGGHVRRAFEELGARVPALAGPLRRIVGEYFIDGGKAATAPYKSAPAAGLDRCGGRGNISLWEPGRDYQALTIAASFAEVWLAKEGHDGLIGINYLRKAERPLLWGLYGAILAGVDYVAIGAGSPAEIPALLDKLSRHEDAELHMRVYGTTSSDGEFALHISPRALRGEAAPISKPKFLAIVSSYALASLLAENPQTRPHGFIIEGALAGGHNAPPSKKTFDTSGRPTVVYTREDDIDIAAIAGLGLPFWLAGAFGSPQGLKQALEMGAAGVQFGTVAALSAQSGLTEGIRTAALELLGAGLLKVRTDALASPSGFPFKIAQLAGTLSEKAVYEARRRRCDVGYLQTAYLTPRGGIGFRCPAEDINAFTCKGGKLCNTKGRVCICSGLLAAAGLGQYWPDTAAEPPLVTLGENLNAARKLLLEKLAVGQRSYTIGRSLQYIAAGSGNIKNNIT